MEANVANKRSLYPFPIELYKFSFHNMPKGAKKYSICEVENVIHKNTIMLDYTHIFEVISQLTEYTPVAHVGRRSCDIPQEAVF